MKKTSFVLVLVVCLSLCACSQEIDPNIIEEIEDAAYIKGYNEGFAEGEDSAIQKHNTFYDEYECDIRRRDREISYSYGYYDSQSGIGYWPDSAGDEAYLRDDKFLIMHADLVKTNSPFITRVGVIYAARTMLILEFKSSGAKYLYIDVPDSMYDDLMQSSSMKDYFNNNIKGKYEHRIMDD